MAKTYKKALPKFEAEGVVLWEKPEYNNYGYKDVLVQVDVPNFLNKKFPNVEHLKYIKHAFKPGEDEPEKTVTFMSMNEKWTKGSDLEPVGKQVYVKFTIKVNVNKKYDPQAETVFMDNSKKRSDDNKDINPKYYVNMYLKEIDVLQDEDEAAAA